MRSSSYDSRPQHLPDAPRGQVVPFPERLPALRREVTHDECWGEIVLHPAYTPDDTYTVPKLPVVVFAGLAAALFLGVMSLIGS